MTPHYDGEERLATLDWRRQLVSSFIFVTNAGNVAVLTLWLPGHRHDGWRTVMLILCVKRGVASASHDENVPELDRPKRRAAAVRASP